jgi:hypothetical protein
MKNKKNGQTDLYFQIEYTPMITEYVVVANVPHSFVDIQFADHQNTDNQIVGTKM